MDKKQASLLITKAATLKPGEELLIDSALSGISEATVQAVAAAISPGARLRLIPTSTLMITAAKHMNQWASLYLAPTTPQTIIIAVAVALKSGAALLLDSEMPIKKVHIVIASMQAGTLLHLNPNMHIAKQRAAARALAALPLATQAYLYINLGSVQNPNLYTVRADFFLTHTSHTSAQISLKTAIKTGTQIVNNDFFFNDEFLTNNLFLAQHTKACHQPFSPTFFEKQFEEQEEYEEYECSADSDSEPPCSFSKPGMTH